MQQRHLGKLFGLSVITLGLYQIYWLVLTRRELMARSSVAIPPVWGLFLPITVLVGIFFISLGAKGMGFLDSGGDTFLHILSTFSFAAFVAGLIIPPMWIWRYGKAIEEVTGGETNRKYVFWMWLIAMSPWMIIVQHELNIVAANEAAVLKKGKK